MLSFRYVSRSAIIFASILALIPTAGFAQLARLHPDFTLKDSPPDLKIYRRKVIPRDSQVAHMHGAAGGGSGLVVVNTGGVGGEPSIAINPLDTNFIAITSFAGNDNAGNAALFYSVDRGLTWNEYFSINANNPPTGGIPYDQDIDYDSGGALQGSFLTGNLRVASGGTLDPINVNSWIWPTDSNGGLAFSDLNSSPFGTDQPWMIINKHPIISPSDVFYSAYDDFSTGIEHVAAADIPVPGNPGATFSRDVQIGNFDGQFVNPGLRLGNDRGNGYMYAIWQFALRQNADGSNNVNWNLNRSTDGGVTWSLNGSSKGIVIANHDSNQPWTPKFGGVNALLGGVNHVAADPNTGDVYCVVGNRDSATGVNRLTCIHLTDDGNGGLKQVSESFVGITGSSATSQFALPSIAVADGGGVGVLFDEFEGIDQSGFSRFTAHVAISYDQGLTWDDTPILTFLGTETDNGDFRQRILGDYQQMKAVGDTFFGVFTANQAALGGQAVMGATFFSIDAVPPGLKLALDPNPVFAGQSSTGTLTLKDPAPLGGLDVQLNSSNPALASVPGVVHIDENLLTATFQVQTADIGAPFPSPVISAVSGPLKTKATLQFVSVRVSVNPQLVFAGDTVPATINIGLPAPPGGVDVKLNSSNQALASIQSSVHLDEGNTQAVVDVATSDLGLPKTDVDITATLGPNQSKFTMTVVPYVVAVEFLDGIFWVPTIATTGGQAVYSRVIIAQIAPTPAGVIINLTSQDSNICQVTPSVTVPAGQMVQYFYVFTRPVPFDVPVDIRASARGSSRAGTVIVLAPVPTRLTLSPTTVEGGQPSGATVYLSGPAPNTGLDVALSSDKPDAVVPPVVHIQPGKDNGTFVVTTTPVANKVVANIKATYSVTSASAPLTITGAGLQAFSVSPTQITAGGIAKATAVLSSPAPPGGVNVALSYVNGNALVNPPASIPISAGATTGSVNLVGAAVTNSTPVTVTATYKATSKQASVTVLGNRVVSVTANPQTLHVGTKSSCRVYLAAPAPAGGVVVNLAATSGELPVSVRVLAGQNNASFNYKAPATVPPGGKATITATYPASVSVTTVISIIP